MTTKHHTRQGYELLLRTICMETGSEMPEDMKKISDYDLLMIINGYLIQCHCIPFSLKEFLIIELK